jgi:hypothetical protein
MRSPKFHSNFRKSKRGISAALVLVLLQSIPAVVYALWDLLRIAFCNAISADLGSKLVYFSVDNLASVAPFLYRNQA